MTEKQAIKILQEEKSWESDDRKIDAFIMAIQALEEIQQYRAIGTVEECRENKDFLEFLYNHIQPNEMEHYLSMYHTKDKVAVNGYAEQCGLMSAT